MPGARTHDIITVVSGVALAPVAFSVLLAQTTVPAVAARETALLVGAHLLSGIMFSPDLDIDSSIDDRWGIFFWIWRPYMWAVPHRSRFLSHGLVFSSLLRLLYFYVVVVVLLGAMAWVFGRLGIVFPDYHVRLTSFLLSLAVNYPREVRAFLIGFVTGGSAHTIADWCVTGGKHYMHRLGIRVHKNYDKHDRWEPRSHRRKGYRG